MSGRNACVLAAVILSSATVWAADPVTDAKVAMGEKDFPGVVAALKPVLASGAAGDRAAAKDLLVKAATDGADAALKGGKDEVAVGELVGAADLIEPDPRAPGLEARAKEVLRNLYGSAAKAKAYDRALWAVTTAAEDFPADPPLAPEGSIESLRVGAAAIAIRSATAPQAYGIVAGLISAKIPASAIDLGRSTKPR